MSASHRHLLSSFALIAAVVAACGGEAAVASPTPSPTPVVTPTPSPSPTSTPSPTPSPSPSPSPSAALDIVPTGQTGYVVGPDNAFALTLPKGWRTLALTASDIETFVKLAPDNPGIASMRDQLPALIGNGLRLFAMKTSASGPSVLMVLTQPGSIPDSMLEASAKATATFMGIAKPKVTTTTIDGIHAVRMDILGSQVGAPGTYLSQLYASFGGHVYVFEVIANSSSQLKSASKLFSSITLEP